MDKEKEQKVLSAYNKLNSIIDDLNELEVFPSLVWLWSWDVLRNKLDDYAPEMGEDWIVNPALTELDIFTLFYDQAGFSLEHGTEQLNDHIQDWLYENVLIEYTEEEPANAEV